MTWTRIIRSLTALSLAGFATLPGLAAEADSGVFGNLRMGVIEAEDETGGHSSGSAIGGKLGYMSPEWRGLSTGATIYTTQQLADDENKDFFASDGAGYSIMGEAFVQGILGNTTLRLGRFELDTPHADTDDIRMIPNTFQGAMFSNDHIPATTLYLIHLDKWAGVDADKPETFKDLNSDDGLTALGAVYEGVENVNLQGWFYDGGGFARLLYLEVLYAGDMFSLGVQFGSQSDATSDNSGPDGDVYGVTASYTVSNFTLTAAYNKVAGTVTNGFGGGPYFTSADDHTIDGTEDQEAAALGLEYDGIERLVLGAMHVDFDQGADETDYHAIFEVNERLAFELIFTDMHEDGHFVRLMGNFSF